MQASKGVTLTKTLNREKNLLRIESVLEQNSLKKTPLRKSILLAFMEAKISLSQADLIEALVRAQEPVDRVSIYRNLVQLKEAGIVHEVDTNSYVFCAHECDAHGHLLLFCQKCHRYQEIVDHHDIHAFNDVLEKFKFFSAEHPVFLRGICTQCSHN